MNRIKVIVNQNEKELVFEKQDNLQTLLRESGVYIPAPCGGTGKCGKCKIRVLEGSLAETESDLKFLSDEERASGYRLACTAIPGTDLTIEVQDAKEEEFVGVDEFAAAVSGGGGSAPLEEGRAYAIAVDIGTTTIGFAIVNLKNGSLLARTSVVNRQRQFGADVISRIQSANDGKLADMRDCVRNQISAQISSMIQEAGLAPDQISKVAIAANTTMLHIFLGLSCGTLGHAPFTPVTLEPVTHPWAELFDGALDCDVETLPGISTYVGADIVSGVYFADLLSEKEPVVLMDIGTNGEIALVTDGKLVCAATAAGPAFEGGNILWGTGSVPGAISVVRDAGETGFETETIGGESPIGICGSGVVDIVYSGLTRELIQKNGKFDKTRNIKQLELTKTEGGEDIVFTQKDVRELQLAKSAIRSGLDAILRQCQVSYDQVRVCYLAGGFGYHLNLTSSIGIGLIPQEWEKKVLTPGNTSLGGAVKSLLEKDSPAALAEIRKSATEWDLPGDTWFAGAFIENLNF